MQEFFLCVHEVRSRYGNFVGPYLDGNDRREYDGTLYAIAKTQCDSRETFLEAARKTGDSLEKYFPIPRPVFSIQYDRKMVRIVFRREFSPDGDTVFVSQLNEISVSCFSQEDMEATWSKAEIYASLIDTNGMQKLPDRDASPNTILRYVAETWVIECARILHLLAEGVQLRKETAVRNGDKDEQVGTFFRDCVAYVLNKFSEKTDSPHKIGSPGQIIDTVNGISRLPINREEFEIVKSKKPSQDTEFLWRIVAYVLRRCFSSNGMKGEDIVTNATSISGYTERTCASNVSLYAKKIEQEYAEYIIPEPQNKRSRKAMKKPSAETAHET